MNKIKFLRIGLSLGLVLGVSGCLNTAGGVAANGGFTLSAVDLPKMTQDNLCPQLGGSGKQPQVSITHSPVAGVPITVRMYDKLSNGTTYDHKTVRTVSDGSGVTRVDAGFLPPCNTNNGRVDSSYRFSVKAAGQALMQPWADFKSGPKQIIHP